MSVQTQIQIRQKNISEKTKFCTVKYRGINFQETTEFWKRVSRRHKSTSKQASYSYKTENKPRKSLRSVNDEHHDVFVTTPISQCEVDNIKLALTTQQPSYIAKEHKGSN